MKHIGFFEGVGGFSLAAKLMGWETIAWCEINPFCHTVLNYHFPNAIGHHDIKKTDFTIYRGKCDIVTGGFPCQPYSAAGKRLGTEDDRHLWPEMLRGIREIQPPWVVGENVRGLTNWNGGLVFDQVQADLENEGYEVTPFLLPACAVNAPHRRDRIWFIAYSSSYGQQQRGSGENRSEENQSERIIRERERIWGDNWRACQQGVAANADISSEGTPGQSGSTESNRCRNNDEQEKWGSQTEQHLGSSEFLRDAADSDNSGTGITMRNDGNGAQENQRWEGQSQSESGQVGSVASDTSNTGIEGMRPEWENEIHGSGNVADTSNKGLQGVKVNRSIGGIRQIGNQQLARLLSPDWQNFPTQSPVCSGNDGISTRLVGITFSKHRQESIKAYGNAVVPQVVVQIFKAIEEYNKLMP